MPLQHRLVSARHYLLAYRIATTLGVGEDQVLLHWACAKISASPDVPDAQLKEALAAKLSKSAHAKYAVLAAHAQVSVLFDMRLVSMLQCACMSALGHIC